MFQTIKTHTIEIIGYTGFKEVPAVILETISNNEIFDLCEKPTFRPCHKIYEKKKLVSARLNSQGGIKRGIWESGSQEMCGNKQTIW